MHGQGSLAPKLTPSVFLRFFLFVGLWLVISLGNLAQVPAGIIVAVAATWVSLRLFPSTEMRISLRHLGPFIARFLRQTAVAGVDVAWRALHPNLPLQTGFVTFPSSLPRGHAHSTFLTIASLLPGTLPAGTDRNGAVRIHCLDISQPVVAELSSDEDLFLRTLGGAPHD
jgi:multicomponent Na+:H+ antiporter subunit E